MNKEEVKSSVLLLLTAAIWGFAFVAQRVGTMHVGAFTFTGLRFALGSLSILPMLLISAKKTDEENERAEDRKDVIRAGIMAGCALFIGASFQQIGLIYTTAGKAGFITGLYIVFVPVFGIFLKQKTQASTWLGVFVAIIGLYFLSVNEGFYIELGDLLEIIGAVFWAIHILIIDHFAKKVSVVKLSLGQFITCSALSLTAAFIFEKISLEALSQIIIPLLYGGILSAGVAYTIQAIAQKHARPSHAAVALSMEAVFASIGGLLMLNERMALRGYTGCALMLTGMLLSQYESLAKGKNEAPIEIVNQEKSS